MYNIRIMAYDEKYRKRTLEYWHEGHTLEQTKKVFRVSVTIMYKWENQLKEEGNLKKHPVKRSFRKIDPEKLKEYVRANPDAYLREIADVFNCSSTAVRKSLKKLNITRKKRPLAIMNKTPKK